MFIYVLKIVIFRFIMEWEWSWTFTTNIISEHAEHFFDCLLDYIITIVTGKIVRHVRSNVAIKAVWKNWRKLQI